MDRPRHYSPTTIALWAIAVLLAANLLVLLGQGSALPAAAAQRQPPIAGGNGIFVMPAQLQANVWGCYLLDVEAGTLCVYQYAAGPQQLKLVSARDISHDRYLKAFNPAPPLPDEVKDLINKQRAGGPTTNE